MKDRKKARIIILTIVCALLFMPYAYAATIFTEDWSNGDGTPDGNPWSAWDGAGWQWGARVWPNSTTHYIDDGDDEALHIIYDTSVDGGTCYRTANANSTASHNWIRLGFWVDSTSRTVIACYGDGAGGDIQWFTDSGTLSVDSFGGNGTMATNYTTIAIDTWYILNFDIWYDGVTWFAWFLRNATIQPCTGDGANVAGGETFQLNLTPTNKIYISGNPQIRFRLGPGLNDPYESANGTELWVDNVSMTDYYVAPVGGGNTDPLINTPSDISYQSGVAGNTIGWIVTDADEATGNYTVYKENVFDGSGTWTNATTISYNVDGESVGTYNFTITATDGQGGANCTDQVNVSVLNNPTVNSPSDKTYTDGDTGNTIGWIVCDVEQGSGDYTVYKNSSHHGSGTWTNNSAINYDIDGESVGGYVFQIQATDGQGGANATDSVDLTVLAEDYPVAPTTLTVDPERGLRGVDRTVTTGIATDDEDAVGTLTGTMDIRNAISHETIYSALVLTNVGDDSFTYSLGTNSHPTGTFDCRVTVTDSASQSTTSSWFTDAYVVAPNTGGVDDGGGNTNWQIIEDDQVLEDEGDGTPGVHEVGIGYVFKDDNLPPWMDKFFTLFEDDLAFLGKFFNWLMNTILGLILLIMATLLFLMFVTEEDRKSRKRLKADIAKAPIVVSKAGARLSPITAKLPKAARTPRIGLNKINTNMGGLGRMPSLKLPRIRFTKVLRLKFSLPKLPKLPRFKI